jgi:hypothetical protein
MLTPKVEERCSTAAMIADAKRRLIHKQQRGTVALSLIAVRYGNEDEKAMPRR